ncbi:MAG TPA: type II secretion system major pseudopilin GspG [Allosphingosinicella sp.]|nr:type II secretion system major pseudopilin GspG [Allosphingosinicella sp.]
MRKERHPGEGRGPREKRHSGQSLRGPGLRRGDQPEAERGFTLVELMVVIVIIGLLATVVIINVLPATDKAAVTKARADVATLEQGVEMYRLNRLRYPSADEGLQAVAREGYVKRLPKDPWGNPYRYAAPGRNGRSFDIYSTGADGRDGGEGKDADIGNWDD